MSSEDSIEARQKNELEVLKAIYGNDLKDLRKKGAWNKWVPPNLSITLTPQQGSSGTQESYVQTDLHIVCHQNYPLSIPKIVLENSKGLANTTLVELKQELEDKAKELKGEVMIFQLSQHVQEFLHQHNKPSMKSFYDEMLQMQKVKEQKDLEEKMLEEDRQRQNMMKEVRERQEILRSEFRLRREGKQSLGDIREEHCGGIRLSNSLGRKNHSLSESSDIGQCEEHKGTISMVFSSREIQRGKCLRHSDNVTLFTGIDSDTGEIVAINEWKFMAKDNDSLLYKQLSSLEQEVNYLAKLKHPNLGKYFGFKYIPKENGYSLCLLREFIYGSSCSSLFINQNYKVDSELLKYIAKAVLSALEYLHRNNVVQKEISGDLVFLGENGTVKLSHYSIHKRIKDLIFCTSSHYSKKADVFSFGKFLLSLLTGSIVADNCVVIPSSLHSDLYDFLSKCLESDESVRLLPNKLLDHSFLSQPVVHFSPQQNENHESPEHNIFPEIPQNLSSLSQTSVNGTTRLKSEFEFLQNLGKGAFGEVVKVRNKLDGGYYAIKIIKLNPKNIKLNRKVIREVMLLSQLNHENVVRYYNSWIETTTYKSDESEESSNTSTNTTTPNQKVPKVVRLDEFTLNDDIEKMAPPIQNVSITFDVKSQTHYENSSDDDESSSEDDDDWVGGYRANSSDSESIEFERDSNDTTSKQASSDSSGKKNCAEPPVLESSRKVDFMYIQMEFCEKSTLRTAIDDNLYLDEDRVWRLFREILEGLAHIHQQGMIHRDLKPVNIFLDSSDHVKIGDFGLATTMAVRSRQTEYAISKSLIEDKDDTVDESKTGQVGTALYVAPEINSASKAFYNQKVDIYSLGIILFEMCYKPLNTGMERIKVLTKLRMKEVVFPDDFLDKKNEKQTFLVRWLLEHDISKRPTSQELLQSEHIPPPVLEERELRELVRHTLSNPQLKSYQYLIASCFKQTVTPAQDITYDRDPLAPSNVKLQQLYDFVKQHCVKVFKQHGGQNLTTPLLMPKSKYYDCVDSCVKLMTHFGNIVSLPHDLRVPFARYVAWNNIGILRRYCIERVYREKKAFGFIPRELYECAFDIVSPTPGGLTSDAEILYIVFRIIKELPVIKNKHVLIKLNHISLLKAILLHCGIRDNHEEVFKIISDVKEGIVPKIQLQNFLISLRLSDNMINLFVNFMNSEFEIGKVSNQFQMITKKKSGEANVLAKQALQDIKTVAQNAEAYGVTFEMVVTPGLLYNTQQYSGTICQFVCELKRKHKHGNIEVLAAGGRYDSMIHFYRNMMDQASTLRKDVQQSAVGISISLDKLVQAIQKEQSEETPYIDSLNVVVYSAGTKQLTKEKIKVMRSLWDVGVKCSLIETLTPEEIHDQLNELKITHAVILKDSDRGFVRLRSCDKDSKDSRHEKTYSLSELVEHMKGLKYSNAQENVQASSAVSSRSDTKQCYTEKIKEDIEADVDILFVTQEKLFANARKRYENQLRSQLETVFKKLNGAVIVLCLNIEPNVIRTLVALLDFDSESQYQKSVGNVIDKHQKYKKYLHEICDEIYNQKMKRTNPVVILYSLNDYFYKLLV